MGMKMQVSSTKYQVLSLNCILLCTLYFVLNTFLFAQQPSPIKKSDKIETIDGKKYYIHSVEKGQTLYSIAKTYSTTVDIVLANNQEAIDGLKSGDKLKIPYSGNTEAIKKEIDKQATVPVKPLKEPTVKKTAKDSIAKKHSEIMQKNIVLPIPGKDSGYVPAEDVRPIGDIHVALFLPLDLAMVENIDVASIARGD